ncbi:hypothetical protein [Bacillus horti]|uniref:Uncharacterized protein n=1 Tax=Caldalkalibacillus horti TaxID=77523 RepID=A0ABT9W4N9_9BACI|nr:hypothetical protein [Bacillus horti]MDQ0168196.1 hypothetical protein [Bacillus horti]
MLGKVNLKEVKKQDRINYLQYLSLADEREMINRYIDQGELYEITLNGETIGRNFNKMIVGTANSSIDNMAFYQKQGSECLV